MILPPCSVTNLRARSPGGDVRYVGELNIPTLTNRTPGLFAAPEAASLPCDEQATTAATSTPNSPVARALRTWPIIAVSDLARPGNTWIEPGLSDRPPSG